MTLGMAIGGCSAVMKCFVASALDREDVDAVYDSCVVPTLNRLSIQPLRVDRIEHNDDIDNKIMDLLVACDLALVDLTYARPSVYFEAGYAAGLSKPVVYTARSDHFRARDDDPAGLLRVHFDLQMKNIVAWTKPNTAYSTRLERRLRFVTKPLVEQLQVSQQRDAERLEFAAVSQIEQLVTLGRSAQARLQSQGLKLRTVAGRDYTPGPTLFAVYRESASVQVDVAVECVNSVTKAELRKKRYADHWFRPYPRGRNAVFHHVLISLKAIPATRRADALPDYRVLDGTTMNRTEGDSEGRFDDRYIHFIDGVRSRSELLERLSPLMVSYGFARHA